MDKQQRSKISHKKKAHKQDIFQVAWSTQLSEWRMYQNILSAINLHSSFATFLVTPMLLAMSRSLTWSLSETHRRLMHLKCHSHLDLMLENLKLWEFQKPLSATYICTSHLLKHTKSLKPTQTSFIVPYITRSLIKHTTLSVAPLFVTSCQWQASPEHHCGQGSKPQSRPLPEHLYSTAR